MIRQAITTRYLGPTNTHGARVRATSASNMQASVAWDRAMSTEDNHRAAAELLATRLKWTGRLIQGGLKDGYAFVFVND